MTPYAVVFQNHMIIVLRRSFDEAMDFAIQKKGDRWKYATVIQLEALEVYDAKGELLFHQG